MLYCLTDGDMKKLPTKTIESVGMILLDWMATVRLKSSAVL
jgi:hypothetical protein